MTLNTQYFTLLIISCDVFKNVIRDMLKLNDVAKLDSSICMKSQRTTFINRLSEIKLSGASLKSTDSLSYYSWLMARGLYVPKITLSRFQMVAVFDSLYFSPNQNPLNQLESLVLNLNPQFQLSYKEMSMICSHCRALKSLHLKNCLLPSIKPLQAALSFSSLQELTFHNIHMHSPLLGDMFTGCGELKKVSFHHCSGLNAKDMSHLDFSNPNITEVSLTDTHNAVACLSHGFVNVQRLSISQFDRQGLSVEQVELLVSSKPHLTALSVSNCQAVSADSLEVFAHNCSELQELNLEFTKVSDATVDQFAKHCPRLQIVKLSKTSITAVSIMSILKHCHDIHTLVASQCKVIDKNSSAETSDTTSETTTERLSETIKRNCCPHLHTIIDLSHNFNLSDAMFLFVSTATPNLTKLNLHGARQITDSAVVALAKRCHKLIDLNLKGCRLLTNTAVNAIATYCMDLKVFNILHCTAIDLKKLHAVDSVESERDDVSVVKCGHFDVVNRGHFVSSAVVFPVGCVVVGPLWQPHYEGFCQF